MKTKIKRHSRSVISVLLAVCMIISCMTVGIIATDAAKTADERVGAGGSLTVYYGSATVDGWIDNNRTIKMNVNTGAGWPGAVDMTDTGETIDGHHVYSGSVTVTSDDLYEIQIQEFDGSTWKSQILLLNNTKTAYSTVNGKFYNGSEWVTPVYDVVKTTLTKPTISFNNSGAVNNGDSAILTVTNHDVIVAQRDTGFTYKLFKDDVEVPAASYSRTNGTFTIPATLGSGDYTVQAIAHDTENFVNSEVSDEATLTVYEPKFALLGNVGSIDIYGITNSSADIHVSTATRGWPTERVNDATYYTGNASVLVDQATEIPGVYKISFTTVSNKNSIDISLYEKSVGQTSFNIDGFVPTVRQDYWVPSGGKTGISILSNPENVGSLKFKPGVTYTITVDERNNTMDISSNAADCNVVARVQTFNSTTGEYNAEIANAVTAIGVAEASPSFSIDRPFESTLTATVNDTANYDFIGWYNNAACSGTAIANTASTKVNVNNDVTYYAFFKQKTPDTVALTVDIEEGSGTVAPATGTNGIHSGTASPYTIYPGATVRLAATPSSGYGLGEVTSTSGTVSVSGNIITITNVAAAATVSVTFVAIPTHTVTVVPDSATYGSISAKYRDVDNVERTASITSSTDLVVRENTVVELTATPGTSGIFDRWTMSNTSYSRSKDTPLSAATIKFIPLANIIATANFSSLGTATGLHLLRNKGGNDPSGMTDTGYTVYEKDGYWWAYIPVSGMNGTGNAYFALSSSTSYTNMYAHSNATVTGVATGSGDYIDAQNQPYNKDGINYNFANSWLKKTTISTVTLRMNLGKDASNNDQMHYQFSVDTPGSGGGGDTPSHDGYTRLYVLDGIRGDNNANGTNLFGDTIIYSSNSGVLKTNYYDATGGAEFIKEAVTDGNGNYYYYKHDEDLDFRVQTTIASGHQAIGVRAFVMNGRTYPAKKGADGKYYADITLEAGSYASGHYLEVIPVYYNTKIPDSDYIKFYVDANTIDGAFGETMGYSIWYNNTDLHGMEGAYPGQPLLSDGSLLYGYFPKYYAGVNADTTPSAEYQTGDYAFSGVLLTNLAEHNSTHKTLLTNWGASTANYQTFDYEDPYEISKLPNIDTIMFVAKYEVTNENHRTGTHWYNASYNKNTDLNTKSYNFLSNENIPASKAALGDFELLRNIDGKPVDVYGNIITEDFSTALFAVSVGNQDVGSNKWDTVWQIYNSSGTNVGYGNPASFIGVADGSQDAALKNKTVYVNYEKFLDSDEHHGNSGDRIDGRWLYSRSTDATSLRLRVATEDESGNLTFMEDGINWAEINDGSTNIGELEDEGETDYTKLLNLPNRTTEVTAKINPVGYMVKDFYMLGDKYSGEGNNGFSTKISDYNALNVVGTSTNFVNAKDNRMVIVVEKIPDTDLVITHQMYGGPGAHHIKGFYYVKAEILNSDGTSRKTYNDDKFTNKPLTLERFTTDAPINAHTKLKITIRTVMSGSSTFNQWFTDDPVNVYAEIDSTEAHGSTTPVEKVIEIDTDTLYGVSALATKTLNYYSDLQSAGDININHYILPESVSAGLSGTAYVQATVVEQNGTTVVAGGTSPIKERTAAVSSDFISTENAGLGRQIKAEIWTKANDPASFEAFYKNLTTEMINETDSSNNIHYTVGNTRTFNGEDYQSAIVFIPISYFFKEDTDPENPSQTITVFDESKKNFTMYSSLELGYEYEITYTYPSKIWKGDQAYKVTGYFTADEFQLLNAARNGFNSENDKKTFIYSKAPYEDNYRQVLSWNCSSATVNVDSNNAKKLIIGVATTAKNDTDVKLTIQLPLAATLTGEGTDNAKFEPTLTGGKVIYDDASGFNKDNIVLTYMTHPRYSINGVKEQIADEVYLQAPQSVVKNVSGEQKDVYFSYWSLKDQKTGSEYARCYSQNLNSAFYKDTVAEAVYENESKEAFDNRVPTDNDKTAKIEILEQSRNQWTDKLNTNAAWASADRLISDYLLTFTYNGKTIKNISGMKYGILFESAGNLDVNAATGAYITDSAHYSAKDDADAVTAAKAAASTFLNSHDSSGDNYLLSIKNASTMDNKNQVEYAYTIAGNNELHRELKYYRVYAFLKTSTGEITISDPIYLTIYDVASIQNGSAEMQSQMITD